MIVKYMWTTQRGPKYRPTSERTWQGWFLLGIVPLYVRCVELMEVKP